MGKQKYYAVWNGRAGKPTVYTTWSETEAMTKGVLGIKHKSFPTREEAELWLQQVPKMASGPVAGIKRKKPATKKAKENTPSVLQYFRAASPSTPLGASPRPSRILDALDAAFDVSVGAPMPKPSTSPRPARQDDFIDLSSDDEGDSSAGLSSSSARDPPLSKEQAAIRRLVVDAGQSVFFTGSAGTGKSLLLRSIISGCKHKYGSHAVAVTASTGIAAQAIGGTTIHSWSGIGFGNGGTAAVIACVRHNRKTRDRWKETQVIIIDEISMLDAKLFELLSEVGRAMRSSSRPFGSIQLVLVGDFYQLPPVPGGKIPSTFAFQSPLWEHAVPVQRMLKTVFRQQDERFVRMLTETRNACLSDETVRAFKALDREVRYEDGFEPVELYPTRREVDYANSTRLKALKGQSQHYQATDVSYVSYLTPSKLAEKLDSRTLAAQRLELKVGAAVMLIKNMSSDNLVNGSIGLVTGFMRTSGRLEATHSGRYFAHAEETGERVEVALIGEVVEQRRVGRKESLGAGNVVTEKRCKGGVWPIVKFLSTGEKQLVIPPTTFIIELLDGKQEACRTQVPLILSWALTIHKAQGQTIERVKLDLTHSFAPGQAYVALSRATSLDCLQVRGFERRKVHVDPRVVKWARDLEERMLWVEEGAGEEAW